MHYQLNIDFKYVKYQSYFHFQCFMLLFHVCNTHFKAFFCISMKNICFLFHENKASWSWFLNKTLSPCSRRFYLLFKLWVRLVFYIAWKHTHQAFLLHSHALRNINRRTSCFRLHFCWQKTKYFSYFSLHLTIMLIDLHLPRAPLG